MNQSQTNIQQVFEAMCSTIATHIINNDDKELRKVKLTISEHFVKKPELRNELELYGMILTNTFKDRSVARAFLSEVLAKAITVGNDVIDKPTNKLSETLKVNDTDREDIKQTICELFRGARLKHKSITESRDFHHNFDIVLEYLLVKRPAIIKEEVAPRIDQFTYEHAVKKFNKKYVGLSEGQREVIQDYLMYRSPTRFRKSLVRRLGKLNEQLNAMWPMSNLENTKKLSQKVREYTNKVKLDESIQPQDIMLNLCEILQLVDEIKQADQNAK